MLIKTADDFMLWNDFLLNIPVVCGVRAQQAITKSLFSSNLSKLTKDKQEDNKQGSKDYVSDGIHFKLDL